VNDYIVTLPIANDLPALSVVSVKIINMPDSESAIARAVERAVEHHYVIDYDRGASVRPLYDAQGWD
jgi:hypothetical protein